MRKAAQARGSPAAPGLGTRPRKHLVMPVSACVAGIAAIQLALDSRRHFSAQGELERSLSPDLLEAYRRGASPEDVPPQQREVYTLKTRAWAAKSN